MKQKSYKFQDKNINYYEFGERCDELIFCVHGLTRNARDFDFLAQALADRGAWVIAMDMLGRGDSDWLEDKLAYNYETYVKLCLGFLKSTKAKNIHFIGTSMGGIIAMILSTTAPKLLKSLILNDIGYNISASAMSRICEYAGDAQNYEFGSEAAAQDYLRETFAGFGITEPAHWQHFFSSSIACKGSKFVLKCDPYILEFVRRENDDFKQISDVDLSTFWDACSCPTLVLRGKESDLLTKQVAENMASRARVELIEFDGCGHAPALFDAHQIEQVINWGQDKWKLT